VFLPSRKSISQTVTIEKNAASIRDIFREIYKQTKRQFVFTDKVLEGAKPVDIHIKKRLTGPGIGALFQEPAIHLCTIR